MSEVLFDIPLYREFAQAKVSHKWQVVMCPGKHRELYEEKSITDALIDQEQKIKAGICAKVEHPFRIIKSKFGFTKLRHLWLKTLFTLFNL